MTDPTRARELLTALEDAVPGAVLLWRGPGRDVDVVVTPGHDVAVARWLDRRGLAARLEGTGRVVWRPVSEEEEVLLDVLASWAWPAHHPPLDDVLRRARRGAGPVLVAAPEDRLAILGAEAVIGRSLASLRERARAAVGEGGGAGSTDPLVRLATRLPERDRLPLRRAALTGLRSPQGRAALRVRLRARPVQVLPPVAGSAARGRLLTLSGLDGAGKSGAALALAARIEEEGRSAVVVWARLALDLGPLEPLAAAVRRVLRRGRGGSSASPLELAAAPAAVEGPPTDRLVQVWAALVAAVHVRRCRRLARLRHSGVDIVCDRWTADALVELRTRYGRVPLAEWVVRRGMPVADRSVLLDVRPEEAARRKPGDQPEAVLRADHRHYEQFAGELGLERLDAEGTPADVRARLAGILR